jgi:hypothetical protein
MNEPKRWREGGDAPSPEVAKLLTAAAPSRPMSPREQARSWRKLRFLVAFPAAAGLTLWVKGGIAAVAIGVSTTATYFVVDYVAKEQPATTAPAASHRTPMLPRGQGQPVAIEDAGVPDVTPEAAAEAAPDVEEQEAGPDARASRPEVAPMRSVASAGSSAGSLDEEVALIARARSAVRSNPAEALELLRSHAQRYPRGKLVMERQLVEIEALQHAGRTQEARSRAETLLAGSAGSLYEARLRRMLEQMP